MDRKVVRVVELEDQLLRPQQPQQLVGPQLPLSVDVRACVLRELLGLVVHHPLLGRQLLVPVVPVLGHSLALVWYYVRQRVQGGSV